MAQHFGSQMGRRSRSRRFTSAPVISRAHVSAAALVRARDLVSELRERQDAGDLDWDELRSLLKEVDRELGDI